MILKSHTNIDRFMLEQAKDPAEIIDYISKNMKHNLAEALIDKIEPGKDYKIKLHIADRYDDYRTNSSGYKMALEIDGWTPCSERMPALGEFVLLSGEFEGVTKTIIAEGSQVRLWGYKFPGIAWMPLPEPYKEK